MQNAVLSLRDIQKKFVSGDTSVDVLRSITISFKQTESYAITGISGSGKSTLLAIIAGFEQPTAGNVFFNNIQLTGMLEYQRELFVREHLGFMFQHPYLLPEFSVIENIAIKGIINGIANVYEQAMILLEQLGLADKRAAMPGMLSGGEQQRVAFARAIIHKPAFLLADEPTAHIDSYQRDVLLNLLDEYAQTHTMGIIISSHDPYVAQRMNIILKLHNGILT